MIPLIPLLYRIFILKVFKYIVEGVLYLYSIKS